MAENIQGADIESLGDLGLAVASPITCTSMLYQDLLVSASKVCAYESCGLNIAKTGLACEAFLYRSRSVAKEAGAPDAISALIEASVDDGIQVDVRDIGGALFVFRLSRSDGGADHNEVIDFHEDLPMPQE